MSVKISQHNGVWFFLAGNLTLDIGVDVSQGYLVYERHKRDASRDYEIAHKLRHLIGKRVVQSPIKDSQITQRALVAAIEAAL